MSDLNYRLVVEILRDTAEKTTEQLEITEKTPPRLNGYDVVEERTYTHDKYDRSWIAGRLQGMADGIEVILKAQGESE